jgi:ATP-dependent DNA helicase RecG
MHLPINVDDVISGHSVEWERLEFKEGWNPETILHTLCAFANDFHNLGGGYLFIGISQDQGRPVLPPKGLNLNQIDSFQRKVLELGHKIQPAYHPIMEPCLIQGKQVLVLRAPGGQNRPYKAPDSLSRGSRSYSYYIRKGSSTVKARREDEIELLALAAHIPFYDRVNQGASVSDLKLPLIQSHLRDIGSHLLSETTQIEFEQLCRQMNIVEGPKEYVLPRNVGLMFFNEHPEQFFPQTQIDIVRFPEGPGGKTIIEKTFQGPLSQQLRDALLFLSNSIVEEIVTKYEDRAEADRAFNYPYAAIEEILVNAVYHRSYEIREPIEIRVLPDHITISSYPGPDRSISLSDLKAGKLVARRYRNRRIGEFLKELRLTEGRGTGIPKTIKAMEDNGSPRPRFETDRNRTFFTAILPIYPSANFKRPPSVTPHVTPHVTPRLLNMVNERVRVLLTFCKSPRDRASIQAHMKLKDRKDLRQRYLHPLLSNKLLAMIDPENPSSRGQKYKTTDLGLAVLKRYEEI